MSGRWQKLYKYLPVESPTVAGTAARQRAAASAALRGMAFVVKRLTEDAARCAFHFVPASIDGCNARTAKAFFRDLSVPYVYAGIRICWYLQIYGH